jgi:hypothetical protein
MRRRYELPQSTETGCYVGLSKHRLKERAQIMTRLLIAEGSETYGLTESTPNNFPYISHSTEVA